MHIIKTQNCFNTVYILKTDFELFVQIKHNYKSPSLFSQDYLSFSVEIDRYGCQDRHCIIKSVSICD